jgi:hypothetical protein
LDAFVRRGATGMLGGVLAFAALNSLSYFARTGANLQSDGGQIGFPWLVWQGNGHSGGRFDPDALLVAVGLSASAAIGCLIALLARAERRVSRPPLGIPPPAIENASDSSKQPPPPPQFSLRGLLLLTTSVAVLFALGQEADEEIKRQVLIPLYWLGPGLLVSTYCVTARLAPQKRAQSVLYVAALLILATFIIGASAGFKDLTLVALGFYVYWTPQCVLLLAGFFVWGLVNVRPTR